MSGMRDIDREMLERIEEGRNELGWKPHSRDEEGNAIFHCTHPGAMNPQTGKCVLRVTYMKVTEAGLLYSEVVHGAPNPFEEAVPSG